MLKQAPVVSKMYVTGWQQDYSWKISTQICHLKTGSAWTRIFMAGIPDYFMKAADLKIKNNLWIHIKILKLYIIVLNGFIPVYTLWRINKRICKTLDNKVI